MIINPANNKSKAVPNKMENFPETILPIMPAVNTYFAASAKILATTFLLSLFTLKVYHRKELKK